MKVLQGEVYSESTCFFMPVKPLEYRKFRGGREDILFSTKTCGIFQPDSLSLSILDFLDRNNPSTREEVIQALSGDFDTEVIGIALDELVQAGFVSNEPEGKTAVPVESTGKRGPLPKVSHLVMNVAHSCNLSCSYCYADGGSYRGRRELMKTETAIELVDFLMDSAEDEKVMITFFGGEPLMNFEAVQAAVRRGEERASALGKRIEFAVTTNGTVLNSDIIRFANEHKIKLTVSIDGRKDAHDRHRKFIDGRGSYDALVSHLPDLMRERQVPARATLTKHNTDVVAVLDHLLSLGFQQVGVAPVDTVDPDFALDESDMVQLLDGFKILARKFRDLAATGRHFGFTNIINLMKLFHQGDTKPLPCGAGVKLMGVSPEGNFYICHRFSGNDAGFIGSVREGVDDRRREELLESLLVNSKPTCRSCWAKNLCGGGCYYLAQLHNGELNKPHTATCKFLLEWYEFGMEIYFEIFRRNPSFLELCAGEDLSC